MIENVILPGSTIGIVGGGQLGRMLALEARRMDYRTVILDPDPGAPAGQVADGHIISPLTDIAAARELASRCDVVTLEWENADVAAIRALSAHVPVRPGPEVLAIAQNRLREKETANGLGLMTAPFRAVRSLGDLEAALGDLGTPAILKTVSGGYDGKGQWVLDPAADVAAIFEEAGSGSRELILEGWVDFERELSVICARGLDGTIVTLPVAENVHSGGILDVTMAPAELSASIFEAARDVGARLTAGLEVIGLLAVEMFVDRDGRVLVNEIAPRPHNSGHYSWEACSHSQFELQLRAVCGLPLQEPILLRPAAMANLLGDHVGDGRGIPETSAALALPMVSLHLYGKAEGRRGRKIGHVTALADTPGEAARVARAARTALREGYERITKIAALSDTPT